MTKPGEKDDDLLTPDEVCGLLRITQKTLYERRNLKAFIDKYRRKC